jgi:hypothetical protein
MLVILYVLIVYKLFMKLLKAGPFTAQSDVACQAHLVGPFRPLIIASIQRYLS